MKEKPKRNITTIVIPTSLFRRLRPIAFGHDKSVSAEARAALERHAERFEKKAK